jgi:hypothetical protein
LSFETALFFETPDEIFRRVFASLKPRTVAPHFEILYCPFANANSFIRMEAGKIEVRITDVLQSAPAIILEALAIILLSKLLRRRIPAEYTHRYKRYLNRGDMRSRLQEMRQKRGRKLIASPQGDAYDLTAMFDELNFRYFFGLMPAPVIGWSLRRSRVTLGHYDASHNTIVLSKLLDRPQVPRLVVEYVMFHEMLHVKHPVEHNGSRRCVHTREFKTAEKEFEGLREAKALLKLL